ncbi:MAG TPA: anthranilate phosphoribosyltransferase [Myxococcaceae bacterium]|nr:anthranilate phosphoribosyltransferase [Myxococcaceae bacterium]
MIQAAIQKIIGRQDLSRLEVVEVMNEIADGKATPGQVGAFLAGLRIKGETVEEITGAAECVRARLNRVRVDHPIFIDTCGTGGDGRNTFNISTAAAFVAAGAGVVVAKHGNRSVSSRCGSADVLGALGVNIFLSREQVEKCIAEIRIGFLYAPHYHPVFKAVAEIRRELGVRTVFNLLGPLANPALTKHQVMGVYDGHWVPILGQVLRELGAVHAFAVHGEGLDEISVSGTTQVAEVRDGSVRCYEIRPEELGLSRWELSELTGGDAAHNASILRDVLGGQKGAPRDAVLANAAAALVVGQAAATLLEGIHLAADSIDRGAGLERLAALVRFGKEHSA